MIKYLGDKTKNIGIKKIMKKNQVVILALALMLMTAGYLNYTNNHENENMLLAGLGDAQLVSANVADGNAPTTTEVVESNSEATDSNEQTQIESNENELNNVQGIDEQNALNGTSEESANNVDANLVHEASIGKIAGEQLIKLMTLGLTEKEAEKEIIKGFLK